MDAQQIKALIDAMAASDLAEMSFSQDGWTLQLVRRPAGLPSEGLGLSQVDGRAAVALGLEHGPAAGQAIASAAPAAPAAPPTPVVTPGAHELQAPLYGVVHLQPAPGQPPFIAAGQAVRAGQTLCVIEAMKVFNEVRAERDAVVDQVLVQSGQEVDAGQALLRFC